MLVESRTGRPAQHEGLLERALEAGGQQLCPVGVAVGAQDDELVAPQPADGVLRAGLAVQAGGHLAQQLVTDLVAERVVHVLEAVDVEEEDGDRGVTRPAQLRVDELVQARPVGQPGEVVVPRLPRGGLLRRDAGRHVGVGDDDVPGLVDPAGLQVVPAGARRMRHRVVGRHQVPLAAGELADLLDHRARARVAAHLQGQPEVVATYADPEAVVVEHLGGVDPRRVGQQDLAVGVDQQGRRRQRVEHGLDEDPVVGARTAAAHVERQLGPARS